MARYNHPETDKTYAAAQRWVDAALKSDDSLFTPGRGIWTPEVIGDLWERFVNHPDTSSDKFLMKFKRQLAGDNLADATTIQLAGELLFIHLLMTSDVTPVVTPASAADRNPAAATTYGPGSVTPPSYGPT